MPSTEHRNIPEEMTHELYKLPWLPKPPDDFAALLTKATDQADVALLRQLAGYRLNLRQLEKIERAASQIAHGSDLIPFRLGLLSNATTSLLPGALKASALRHGIALEVVESPFDNVMQVALDANSEFVRASPDAVLLALDHRGFELDADPFASADVGERMIEDACALLGRIREGLKTGCNATLIYQTIPALPMSPFANLDRRLATSTTSLSEALNSRIARTVTQDADALFDVATLAATAGLENWHDPVAWNSGKFPFAHRFIPAYADALARLIATMRRGARKCLVLDLDNTLWGGVIGDDGLEGITLGQGDPVGESFLSLQRLAVELHRRGILLAACSKNDPAQAVLPFKKHPDMVLKEDHFAAFVANWNDKPENLREIARSLNIGLGAMVMVDDDPVERARVREVLPDVAVPEIPDDPAYRTRVIAGAGYFDAVFTTAEDKDRNRYYQADAQRGALRATARSVEDFLASLEMSLAVAPVDGASRARAMQLVNKTNQFNLTTKRFSGTEFAAWCASRDTFAIQARLSDRFGDNGLISVLMGRHISDALEIDTWVMSCRVVGRMVEHAVLDELVGAARAAGIGTIEGTFVPSKNNGLVKDLYETLGFVPAGHEKNSTRWRLAVGEYMAKHPPVAVDSTLKLNTD